MSVQELNEDIASGASAAAVAIDKAVIAMNVLSTVFMATGLCMHNTHMHDHVNNVASICLWARNNLHTCPVTPLDYVES